MYRIDEYTLIQFFKDDMRINAEKVIQVSDKGVLNNVISNYIFKRVSMVGINHHLIQKINMREQLIYALNIIPVKVCITIVIYNEVCV
nr:phosphoribosylaminoimidazolesuccinocarboxamide synthase [Orientia tsutsugamushi]